MKSNKNSKTKKTRFVPRKRTCSLCMKGVYFVDYKDIDLLKKYISYSAKILPRRVTGLCNKHQRMVMLAIKRARFVGLLPYIVE